MRCLGRLVSLIFVMILLAVGWLYRDELVRKYREITDPMSVVRREGRPTEAAGTSARAKISRLSEERSDSILLTPSEVGMLLFEGLGVSPSAVADSLTVELGDRTVRLEGLVRTQAFTDPVRKFIQLPLREREPVSLTGTLTPAGNGVAEWRLERVTLRGFPLPSDLVSRLLREAGLPNSDGRMQVRLPRGISGFRIRPEGAALYREGKP